MLNVTFRNFDGNPVTTTAPLDESSTPVQIMQVLEDRSYATYGARLQASVRLSRRGRAWNAALIALATSATAASIGMLTDSEMYGMQGDTLMVCVSVLSLVASLIVTGLDHSGRSRDMFTNYRKIQRLSGEAERGKSDSALTRGQVGDIYERYDTLLDESENHTEADYLRQDPSNRWKWAVLREDVVTWFPYATLALPIGLVVPLIRNLAWW